MPRTFGGCEAVEQHADVSPERIHGPWGGFAKQCIEFGKQFFNGIAIGGIRRERADVRPDRFNGLFNARHFVTASVVRNDDVAGVQRRA